MSSLSSLSVPITPYGLLGTLGNLELRKRMGVSRLYVNNADLVGLLGDPLSGPFRDSFRHDWREECYG